MVKLIAKCLLSLFGWCALIVGTWAGATLLQLHVQHLELQQARQAETVLGWIENEANDTRLSEYRPD